MVKPYIAMASLVGGILSAGLAIWIQAQPSALTSPEPVQVTAPEVEVVPALTAQNVEESAAAPAEAGVIMIDPVLITAPRKAAPKPALAPAAAPEQTPEPQMATEPCSDWRELGPKSVDTAPGAMHKVRQLCVS